MNTTDRAFGKVASAASIFCRRGLGEEDGTARIHSEVQVIALGGDVEQGRLATSQIGQHY
jgi:hypothetical protein